MLLPTVTYTPTQRKVMSRRPSGGGEAAELVSRRAAAPHFDLEVPLRSTATATELKKDFLKQHSCQNIDSTDFLCEIQAPTGT